MNIKKLIKKNKHAEPRTFRKHYKREIENRIRLRYSISDELAIQRKKDIEVDEFNAYNEYVEQCIADVKAEFDITE